MARHGFRALIAGTLSGIGILVFALTAARLRSTPLLKGALYGILLLLLLIPLQPSAIQQEITAFRGHLLAAGVLFWLVYASYGVLLATIVTRGEGP